MTDDGRTYANACENGERVGNFMQTFTGGRFWPGDMRAEDLDIRDIAHALSLQCRYAGHCIRFYSVAEHSVLVSRNVPEEHALVALLQDAPEAYLLDIPRPLKPSLTGYAELEDGCWSVMAERWKLPLVVPPEVRDIDTRILLDERAQNMTPTSYDWNIPGEPVGVTIECWDPPTAETEFLARFMELSGCVFDRAPR